MKENLLIDKSIAFAARIVKLYQHLIRNKKETIISKQIVRSGTSIGANINEANYGQSKADFISKMHIALKETAVPYRKNGIRIFARKLRAGLLRDIGNSHGYRLEQYRHIPRKPAHTHCSDLICHERFVLLHSSFLSFLTPFPFWLRTMRR